MLIPLLATGCLLALYAARPRPLEHLNDRLIDLLQRPAALAVPSSTCIVALDRRQGAPGWTGEEIADLVGKIVPGRPRVVALLACAGGAGGIVGGGVDRLSGLLQESGNAVVDYTFAGFCRGPVRDPGNLEAIDGSRFAFVTNPWGSVPDMRLAAAMGIECVDGNLVAAAASGFSNVTADRDGRVRRVPLVVEAGGGCYQSIAVAILKTWFRPGRCVLRLSGGSVQGIALDGIFLTTDAEGNLRLRARAGAPPRHSASQLLRGAVEPGLFRNRAVIIAAESRAALAQARAVEDALHNSYLRESPTGRIIALLFLATLPVLIAVAGGRLSRPALTIVAACGLAVILCVTALLIRTCAEAAPALYPSLGVVIVWGLAMARRGKRMVTPVQR